MSAARGAAGRQRGEACVRALRTLCSQMYKRQSPRARRPAPGATARPSASLRAGMGPAAAPGPPAWC